MCFVTVSPEENVISGCITLCLNTNAVVIQYYLLTLTSSSPCITNQKLCRPQPMRFNWPACSPDLIMWLNLLVRMKTESDHGDL